MQNLFYGDKRYIIKWSVLLRLAEKYNIEEIKYIAYYRESKYEEVRIGNEGIAVPEEVMSHFRNIKTIKNLPDKNKRNLKIYLYERLFSDADRKKYHQLVFKKVDLNKKIIILLDPDTGIASTDGQAKVEHVKPLEIKEFWDNLRTGSFLVIYQHSNRNKNWEVIKKKLLAKILEINSKEIVVGKSKKIASDVVFFIVKKK